MPRRPRTPLTEELLYERTLAIVDSHGLDALTMRRLADDVGVQAPSLYNHVSGKEELLEGALRLMRSEVKPPEPLPDDWKILMEAILTDYLRVLAAHPNMMPLAAHRLRGENDSGLSYLADQGFTTDQAVELWQSLVALVVGFSIFSSGYADTDTTGLDINFADRVRQWRDETCATAMKMIMTAYEAERTVDDTDGPG